MNLILFFIEKDSHLSEIVKSSLRPYDLEADPDPLLSLSLNINTLATWYGNILKAEMMAYTSNAIKVHLCAFAT
jgi:hypothetical protein